MSQALEEQIARAEREVEALRARLKVLNDEQLNDEELNRASLEELLSVSSKTTTTTKTGKMQKNAPSFTLTPQESLKIIRERMRDLEREFGIDVTGGESTTTRTIATATSATQTDPFLLAVKTATVSYGSESQTFRLSDTTTFGDLCEDACRIWKVPGATLRDENNAVWPGTGVVREEIARYLRENGGKQPTLLLFHRIVSSTSGTQHNQHLHNANKTSEGALDASLHPSAPTNAATMGHHHHHHHPSTTLSSRRSSAASLGVSTRKLSAMGGVASSTFLLVPAASSANLLGAMNHPTEGNINNSMNVMGSRMRSSIASSTAEGGSVVATANRPPARTSATMNSSKTETSGGGREEDDYGLGSENVGEDDDEDDDDNDDDLATKTRKQDGLTAEERARERRRLARELAIKTLSPLFHDPEYRTRMDDAANATFSTALFQRNYLDACAWLVLWAITVGLVVSAMVYRLVTVNTAFDELSTVELLGNSPFFVGGNHNLTQQPTKQFLATSSSPLDFYDWYSQILLPFLTLAARPSSQQFLIDGVVLIKQSIVNGTNCGSTDALGSSSVCYPSYSQSASDTSDLAGGRLNYSTLASPMVVYGVYAVYDKGGYPMTATSETGMPPDLLPSFSFFPSRTRLLSTFFNLGNLNVGALQSVYCLFEINPFGAVHTSISTASAPLSVYGKYANTPFFPLLVTADVFLLLYSWIAVMKWIILPLTRGEVEGFWAIFQTIWNWVLLALALVATAQVICCLVYEVSLSSTFSLLPSGDGSPSPYYRDLRSDTLFRTYDAIRALSSTSLVLLLISLFKHIELDESFTMFAQSMHRAGRALGVLVLLYAVALGGMSAWAHLAFGPSSSTFAEASSSALALSSFALSGSLPFSFIELRERETSTLFFTVLFFLIWVFAISILLYQMMGAVIMDAYFETHFVLSRELRLDEENDNGENVGGNVVERVREERSFIANVMMAPFVRISNWFITSRRKEKR